MPVLGPVFGFRFGCVRVPAVLAMLVWMVALVRCVGWYYLGLVLLSAVVIRGRLQQLWCAELL